MTVVIYKTEYEGENYYDEDQLQLYLNFGTDITVEPLLALTKDEVKLIMPHIIIELAPELWEAMKGFYK